MPRCPLQWSTHQAITTIEGKKVEIDLFPYGYSINTFFLADSGIPPIAQQFCGAYIKCVFSETKSLLSLP